MTSLHRMSSEMMSIGVDHMVFPVEEVEAVYDPEGAAGGQVHDGDGLVAPSVGCGCSRAVACVDLPFLHEMRVLFWQKRAIYPVTIL